MKKRIILFTDSLGAGGAQRQLVGLAVMFSQKGFNVQVCTYQKSDFYKPYLDENSIPNQVIPGAANTKQRIFAVRKYFLKEKPDWVIAYQETPSLVACAAKILGCSYNLIVSERNTTQTVGMNERVRFFLYHWADAIVPNSYAQENWLLAQYPWMASKINTITNYVNLDLFAYKERDRHEIPEILIAASIWPSKNTLGFIEAIALLKNKGVACHFSWYGRTEENVDYYNKCQDRIESLNLNDMITLLPKTSEIQVKYQEADYFCLPSFYEGTPNVLCEAISCGLPVMVSSICDNSRYAKSGINAVLFDPKSVEDMANQICSLLIINEEEYHSYRKASRQIAEELLSKDFFVSKYLQIIDSQKS